LTKFVSNCRPNRTKTSKKPATLDKILVASVSDYSLYHQPQKTFIFMWYDATARQDKNTAKMRYFLQKTVEKNVRLNQPIFFEFLKIKNPRFLGFFVSK